jgi:hypothetical protein
VRYYEIKRIPHFALFGACCRLNAFGTRAHAAVRYRQRQRGRIFVTITILATVVWTFVSGRFVSKGGLVGAGAALGGLILSGLIAASLAGYVTKVLPARTLLSGAGLLLVGLVLWQGIHFWPRLFGPDGVQ